MNLKLDASLAQTILDRVAGGEKQKDLAIEYGISPSAVSNLVAGKSWPNLLRNRRTPPRRGTKLTPEDIQTILRRLQAGEKPGKVALDYGVSRQAVANIQKGRAWKEVPRPEVTPPRPARRKVWETP
jgi:uncharacterized protein (DUF433 family)